MAGAEHVLAVGPADGHAPAQDARGAPTPGRTRDAATSGDRSLRRLALRGPTAAAAIYVVLTLIYFVTAPHEHLVGHTAFNHYALLADSWLHGRLDLGGPPPDYAMNNDFAEFGGKYFVSFPPFPALLLLPVVKLA